MDIYLYSPLGGKMKIIVGWLGEEFDLLIPYVSNQIKAEKIISLKSNNWKKDKKIVKINKDLIKNYPKKFQSIRKNNFDPTPEETSLIILINGFPKNKLVELIIILNKKMAHYEFCEFVNGQVKIIK